MPKLPPLYQQCRQAMGKHTSWQDKKQGSQQDQDRRVKRLAKQPGLHTGSVHRQNASIAMVQLISIVSAVQVSSANPAIIPQRSDEISNKLKTKYGGVDNLSSGTEQTVPIRYQDNDMLSPAAQKTLPPVSLLPSPSSIDKLVDPRRYKNVEAPRLKRSTSSLDNIPNGILAVIQSTRFNDQLRNTLDTVFRLAGRALEVRYAPKQEKNLYLLLKCIQQMHIFILKNDHLYNGRAMLNELINLADNLDGPKEKVLVDRFKQQYLSEGAIKKAMLVSNSSIYDIVQDKDMSGDMIILSPLEENRINLGEQARHLNRLLEKMVFLPIKLSPLSRINSMVDYLSEGFSKDRINAVARVLMIPLGEYGSEKGEFISDERKMAVIGAYMSQQIFGMSMEAWCAKQVQIIQLYGQSRISNEYLHDLLNDALSRRFTHKGALSPAARAFYEDNVIKKLLPNLTLQLNATESEELRAMNVTHPRWGFVLAGARLLTDNNIQLDGMTLTDIEDCGVTLHAALSQGAVPLEYSGYFKLPALLHYCSTDLLNLSMINEQDMQKVYSSYSNYIHNWEKKNNPLVRLPDLFNSWQNRTMLAKDRLTRHNISDDWLTRYLNEHDELKIGQVTLPNIDTVFAEQNRQLADTVCELDKLLLPTVFNSLSEEEQRFIEQSKVDRVRIQFNAMDSIRSVPLPPSARMGIQHSGAFIYRIPERIDLLQCTWKGKERIYALVPTKSMGNYTLRRVDRDRQDLLWLLDDMTIPMRYPDYKVRVISHATLKSYAETPQALIDNLADYHRKKLFTALSDQGYDKTTREKVIDFLLRLVPFYTCITESLKGNEREAIPACILDVFGLIPFAGQTALTAGRFGRALAGSTAMALRYGARQTSIKAMNKQLINHIQFVAEEISPQVVRGLGIQFIRGLDPGFELLAMVGAKGIRAMGNVIANMPNKSAGLNRLLNGLENKAAGLVSNFAEKNLKVESLFSPAHGRKLDVAVVGEDGGKLIWVQVNRETGEFFGKKFLRNGEDNLEAIQVRLRHQGKKRKGDTAGESSQAGSSKRVFSSSKKTIDKAFICHMNVCKKYVSDSAYVQYYTKCSAGEKGSDTLVLSAHGGYTNLDKKAPVVVMPSDITIQLLTPHKTKLLDPGLDHVVNAGKDLRAYVTLRENKVINVDFLPQEKNPEWLKNYELEDAVPYKPKSKKNTLGHNSGLQNVRHVNFEGESEDLIVSIIEKNRNLAKEGKADLTDILSVNRVISVFSQTSLGKHSIQAVLDLDKAEKLVNAKGERYKKIIFSHCRVNLNTKNDEISSYIMVPEDLSEIGGLTGFGRSKTKNVVMTELYRKDVNQAFDVRHYNVGRFILIPARQKVTSTMAPSLAVNLDQIDGLTG